MTIGSPHEANKFKGDMYEKKRTVIKKPFGWLTRNSGVGNGLQNLSRNGKN